jgi:hypothetical protein
MIKALFYMSLGALVISLGTIYFVLNKVDQQTFGAAINVSTSATSTLKGLNLSQGCLTYNGGSCITSVSNARYGTVTQTNVTLNTDNGTASSTSISIPALLASSTIQIQGNISVSSSGVGSFSCAVRIRDSNGNTFVSGTASGFVNNTTAGFFNVQIFNTAVNTQITTLSGMVVGAGAGATFGGGDFATESTSALNLTGATSLVINILGGSSGAGSCTVSNFSVTINP